MSDEQIEQIEVPEAPTATPERIIPSRDEVKKRGWSDEEIEKGEKFGLVKKAEEKKPEAKTEAKPEAKTPSVIPSSEPRKEERRRGVIPELNLSPEQEAKLREILPPGTNLNAFYIGMKNERAQKQRWKQEAEQYKARIEELERGNRAPVKPEGDNGESDDDKPLTMRQIKAMQEQARAEQERRQKEMTDKARIVAEAQQAHEEYARSTYEDFDETVKLAGELMKNLDEYFPSGKGRSRILGLMEEFRDKVNKSHELDAEDFNEADIAYEIGKLHPNYGKKADSTSDGTQPEDNPNQGNGGQTPEKLQRIEKNTQRRVASAAIPGGNGKRTIAASEMTLADLNRLPSRQYAAFKQKYPDRVAQLLRG